MFKAQIDINGVPGQLIEASVRLYDDEPNGQLGLMGQIEDADTGEVRDIQLKAVLLEPVQAPKAGGPVPPPSVESEDDWEQDDDGDDDWLDVSFEQQGYATEADDSAPDQASSAPPIDNHPEPESASSGLTALYQALTRQLANAQPESPASPDGDTEDARGFLKLLVERNQLELESGKGVDDLVLGTTAIMASTLSHDDKAQKLSAWLFTQEAVAELYAADDDLAMLLSQW